MTQDYDLIIIGAGPGGYVCAIRAAQLGLKVACVEKNKNLGGTCLNVGCIPSKALLHSSYKYYEAKTTARDYGIGYDKLSLNLTQMMYQKQKVIDELTQGIAFLFKKNGVHHYKGCARIEKTHHVSLDTRQHLVGKKIVLATGSTHATLPNIHIDEKKILSSTGALDLDYIPQSMVVVGGGYIGLELGSVWSRLGASVTVIEHAERIVPAMDREVGHALKKALEHQGIKFLLGHAIQHVSKSGKTLKLILSPVKSGKNLDVLTETVLVSVGRQPCIEGLEPLNLALSDRGHIKVSQHFETSVSDIYAIGDVIHGPMLAHKAEEEGVAVAEYLAGKSMTINHNLIPAVVYTHPEVATVGKTQEMLDQEAAPYNVGTFPFLANSRAKAIGETTGFVKILSHKQTDEILGVHVIGATAGTLIAEAVAVMTYGGSAEDLGRICHAHPTESEAMKEAGLSASQQGAIHL